MEKLPIMLTNLEADKKALMERGQELTASFNQQITAINQELQRIDGALSALKMLAAGHTTREEAQAAEIAADAVLDALVIDAQPEAQ